MNCEYILDKEQRSKTDTLGDRRYSQKYKETKVIFQVGFFNPLKNIQI